MALGGITGAITGQKNGTTEHYKKGMPQHATPKKREKTDKIRHHNKEWEAIKWDT